MDGASARSSGLRARGPGWLRGDAAVVGVCLAVWLAVVARIAPRLPADAATMGDSGDYLAAVAHRPPLYGWLLAAYRGATGGFDHLPLLQFLLVAAGLLLFAVGLGRLLRSPLAAGAAVVLVLHHVQVYDAPRFIMSESLFVALVLAGMGLMFAQARGGGAAGLLAAAVLFALAAATRTTGTALLLLPPLAALLDARLRLRAAALRAGSCLAVAGLVLALAMAGNWARHGRLEIGSFAGVALLGKALLLLEPGDLPALPAGAAAPAASTAPVAAEARRLIAAQPDLPARMRAQMQGTEDVRFAAFFPEAEASWPEWRDAAWRDRSDLGLAVALRLMERHPAEFLRLWARDWGALVLYPNYWPAWATAEPPDPGAFAACRLHGNCWALARYGIAPHWLAAMLLASLAGAAGGLAVVLGGARRVLGRRAAPATALFWATAVVVQASLLLSSAAEAGFVRYTVGLHVLGTALLLFLAVEAPRALPGAWRTARLPPRGAGARGADGPPAPGAARAPERAGAAPS